MKIRREYQLTIKINGKSRVFSYKQATAYETLQFIEELKNEDFNLILWVYDFLNGICTTNRPFWRKNNLSHSDFANYVLDFEKIFTTIQDTYFFGTFAKTQKTEEETEESMPFDAYLALLSEKLNIDPIKLLENYTFEQIGELGKGIVYLGNMATEEGRKKNERMKIEEKMKKVDRDQVAETLAKLEEWKKKNLTGKPQEETTGTFTK